MEPTPNEETLAIIIPFSLLTIIHSGIGNESAKFNDICTYLMAGIMKALRVISAAREKVKLF
ncbi:hypothetical protein BADSM9389_16340 [Buttiauxella agrestis]|nr:hypothetical protein BADSM9389_16340 [Buttiauxella agrestis]